MSNPALNVAAGNSAGRPSGERTLAFDEFRFDPARQELVASLGEKVALTPKALTLLQYMLANAGRVLSKDELMRVLWGEVVVTDDSLVQCVKDLRTALGSKGQQLITTLPRRGYMFDVEVREPAAKDAPTPPPPPAPALQAPAPAGGTRSSWARGLLLGVVLLLGVLIGAGAVWKRESDGRVSIDDEIRKRRSVAVLAFIDSQGGANGSTLGLDLADVVGSQLVRAGIRVIGRAATVRQDPAEPQFERIGQEQGVRYVLAGRINRADGKTSVDTYLTEIGTGAVYRLTEGEFNSDADATRPQFGRQVLIALQSRYYEIEVSKARESRRSISPVDRLALAWHDLDRGRSRADLESARRHLEAATLSDPYSVEAMLALGVSHLSEFYSFYSASPQATLEQAEQILKRALELAPDNTQVLSAWAEVLMLHEREDEAMWVWRRALDVESENPVTSLRIAGALVRQGRAEEAQRHLQKVTDLRPFQNRRQQSLNQILAEAALATGRDEEAYRILKQWAAEFPSSARPHLLMAAIDALKGRDQSALDHMAIFRAAHPLASLRHVAQVYPSTDPQFLAQRERLLDGLRKAGLPDGGN
ncbi:winged helix-turn-helix domain-containing protein [Variovorax sp. J22R24]|uniref:winged helix-turn-helix domain-containing protein n=1 Tax=Variovorax gracilis TaxID=3053502 RepID=UPI0025756FCA|nr:winged helix-turn-helix domain-containing protein [Variovorax sp. J22R24]MDM0110010.1 winged helix-turn-helix domain-containing protein [Variovorax sp. J22R24]